MLWKTVVMTVGGVMWDPGDLTQGRGVLWIWKIVVLTEDAVDSTNQETLRMFPQ